MITKTHTFRPEDNPLTDAVMLIRNPYDCFLSEFNRVTSGSDHTGKASNAGKSYFLDRHTFLNVNASER